MSASAPLILIAEDNPGLSRVLAHKFESNGFSAVVCDDGQAAHETFQRRNVAAVVTDHEMPGRTGLDLCRDIHRQAPHVPIVLVSGREREITPEQLDASAPLAGRFGKPFSPNAVVECVRNAIAGTSR